MLTLLKVCIVEEERMMSVSQDVRNFTDSKGGTIYHYHLQMHTYIASSGQHIAMKVHTKALVAAKITYASMRIHSNDLKYLLQLLLTICLAASALAHVDYTGHQLVRTRFSKSPKLSKEHASHRLPAQVQ